MKGFSDTAPAVVDARHSCLPAGSRCAANRLARDRAGGWPPSSFTMRMRTRGPANNATVCGCPASMLSKRRVSGSSNSMVSPERHSRRMEAKRPGSSGQVSHEEHGSWIWLSGQRPSSGMLPDGPPSACRTATECLCLRSARAIREWRESNSPTTPLGSEPRPVDRAWGLDLPDRCEGN